MALADDVEAFLGANRLKALTNFDTPGATTINVSRLASILDLAKGMVRKRAGLTEPEDTTSAEHGTYTYLVVLATVFLLERGRNRFSSETDNAKRDLDAELDDARQNTQVTAITNSVVDTTDQDQEARPARFAPGRFDAYRIGSRRSDFDAD